MSDLLDLPVENLNTRFLVWKKDRNPDNWTRVLLKKTSIRHDRAKEILAGSHIAAHELKAIVEGFGETEEELRTVRLLGFSSKTVLMENLQYLIGTLPRGEEKEMANAIGVSKETVSRWARGKSSISAGNIKKVLRYLGLDTGIDLKTVPLFLTLIPVGQFAQRRWLLDRLQNLPASDLSKLFPALERLLDHENR